MENKLCWCVGAKIRIIDIDNKVYEGVVIQYTNDDEGDEVDPNGDSISLQTENQGIIGFYLKEILSYEML